MIHEVPTNFNSDLVLDVNEIRDENLPNDRMNVSARLGLSFSGSREALEMHNDLVGGPSRDLVMHFSCKDSSLCDSISSESRAHYSPPVYLGFESSGCRDSREADGMTVYISQMCHCLCYACAARRRVSQPPSKLAGSRTEADCGRGELWRCVLGVGLSGLGGLDVGSGSERLGAGASPLCRSAVGVEIELGCREEQRIKTRVNEEDKFTIDSGAVGGGFDGCGKLGGYERITRGAHTCIARVNKPIAATHTERTRASLMRDEAGRDRVYTRVARYLVAGSSARGAGGGDAHLQAALMERDADIPPWRKVAPHGAAPTMQTGSGADGSLESAGQRLDKCRGAAGREGVEFAVLSSVWASEERRRAGGRGIEPVEGYV
ncbi:hypothetical protein B0H14DRAFT_2597192 [Mycena olivaceomarginata]|nr:hypothetical protein B0H14DRAFT_2597192 [Mycena olivaceomarginata]